MFDNDKTLKDFDPDLWSAIDNEKTRQEDLSKKT